MPYERVGAMKLSDHWVRSPVLNINRACQTCHKLSEEELRSGVETIEERTFELRNIAIDAGLHSDDTPRLAREDRACRGFPGKDQRRPDGG